MPLYIPELISWQKKVLAYSVLALILYVLLSAIVGHPWISAILATALTISCVYSSKRHKLRLKKMTDERTNEGICTFARSFDRKEVDTWIIRAVHEELQPQMMFPEGTCPLRASDKLEEDLIIDPEEIEDLIPRVAQLTGRSLEDTERNPFYGKITTVGDIVLFINGQPKISA